MIKKANLLSVAACALALAALGVAGMAWFEAWANQPLEDPAPRARLKAGDAAYVPLATGDLRLDLASLDEGGNTEALWHCGKTLLGARHDYSGAWGHLGGWVVFSPASRTLRAAELRLSVGSLRGHGRSPAPGALINTVRKNQWFLEEEHPLAVFRAKTIAPRTPGQLSSFDAAVEGWTHTVTGPFQLNGIERDLQISARIEFGEDWVKLDAKFPISRAEFEVAGRRGRELPAEIDDQVLIEVHIHATPDPMSRLGELHRQLVGLQAEIGRLEEVARGMAARMGHLETTLDALRRAAQAGAGALGQAELTRQPAQQPTQLPARFTDLVDYRNLRADPRYKDLGRSPEFEMVAVPGDPARGDRPLLRSDDRGDLGDVPRLVLLRGHRRRGARDRVA